jgi:hypothetical protein
MQSAVLSIAGAEPMDAEGGAAISVEGFDGIRLYDQYSHLS